MTVVPLAGLSRALAQSAWSWALPSPASVTVRVSWFLPVTSTVTGTIGDVLVSLPLS